MKTIKLIAALAVVACMGMGLQSCKKETEAEPIVKEAPKKLYKDDCAITRCNPDGLDWSCSKSGIAEICLEERACKSCTRN